MIAEGFRPNSFIAIDKSGKSFTKIPKLIYNKIMSKRIVASFLLMLALVSSMGGQSSFAQSGGEKYFKETRHWVKGEFLTKYNSIPEPLKVFGYPITAAFLDPKENLLVQYFEKTRFELHLDAKDGQRVQLSPLGDYLYQPGKPISIGSNSATCRKFQDGYQVCYAFLDFFDKYGGVEQFGVPISNMEYHNGLIVQYFFNARFEWHNEFKSGQRVTLANLGMEYFHVMRENPRMLEAESGDEIIRSLISLKVRAYPLKSVTSRDGKQTIFVIVQDQTLVPVAGAQITLALRMPSGEEVLHIIGPLTNEKGITSLTFPFSSEEVGIVQITVKAKRDNLEAENHDLLPYLVVIPL